MPACLPAFQRPPLIVPRVIFELPPQALLQLLQQPSDALVLLVDEVKKQGFDGLVRGRAGRRRTADESRQPARFVCAPVGHDRWSAGSLCAGV
jgi:hypothetical protein